jgi:hypothetical protein
MVYLIALLIEVRGRSPKRHLARGLMLNDDQSRSDA